MKFKYNRFNNKNIIFTQPLLDKQEKERIQLEKMEKLNKLNELRKEVYDDSSSDEDEEEIDFIYLMDKLNDIKNKGQLKQFIKDYKNQINNLLKKEKDILLSYVQQKFY